jgi:peptidyl-prolyl cis-trans isomerase D
MFDFVHNSKRLVQIFLALIILPFALWGVDSYRRSGDTTAPATVNGTKISQQEFEDALRQQQDRMRQVLGGNFDEAMLDTPEMKRAVMDSLIAQRLLVQRAGKLGLTVSDEQVAQVIQGIEAFQDGGQFDKKRYESVLSSRGMSPLTFEARLRDEILGQLIRDAYVQNGFASSAVADGIIRLNEQQRGVSVSSISFQPFIAKAKVDEADLRKYYEQNQKEFQSPEQAKVEYVRFSISDLLGKVKVDGDEVRQYYDAHQSDFGIAEQRRAAHILITVAANAPQAEQDEAKSKAEQLLQQAKQNPARFAELAMQNSKDPGSAANGGDLGFFSRGMMVKPFEDAVFALKQGAVSDLVKSDFGYHIIKLLAVSHAKITPLDEVREAVASKLRQQKAADMFAELAEKFSNTVYEQSDTLKPAADLVGAKIEQSGWLSMGMAADETWTPKILQAIFADEAIKNKRNTAAIEVAPNLLVASRVLEHKPAAVLAFGEVRETILGKLSRQQAMEMAAIQGKVVLEQLRKGNKPTLTWSAVQSITRAQHGSLDAGLARMVFQANAARLPQFIGAETARGYMLVRIDAVKDIEEAINDAKRMHYVQQLRQLTGEELFQNYLSDARQQADIKVNLPEVATDQP